MNVAKKLRAIGPTGCGNAACPCEAVRADVLADLRAITEASA